MRNRATVVLRLVLAAVLVTAAGLKINPVLIGAREAQPAWFELGVAGLELALAALLVSNRKPMLAIGLAAGCWAVFLGVAGVRWWHGAKSCGCFGMLEVHSWLTAVFDFCCLVALGVVWILSRFESNQARENTAFVPICGAESTELTPESHNLRASKRLEWAMVVLVTALAVAIGVDGGLRWRAHRAEVLREAPAAGGP